MIVRLALLVLLVVTFVTSIPIPLRGSSSVTDPETDCLFYCRSFASIAKFPPSHCDDFCGNITGDCGKADGCPLFYWSDDEHESNRVNHIGAIGVQSVVFPDNSRQTTAVCPAGPAGPKGDQGDAGPVGPAGATGATGPAGDVGPAGPAGAVGPKGDPGSDGPVGPAGPAGVPGPIGPKGDTGETGPAGPAGEIGPAGPKGDTGAQGAVGPTGLTGATGPVGPSGPAGAKGDTGATGPAGETGPAGPTGETGPVGPVGPIGPVGPAGPPGGFYPPIICRRTQQPLATVDAKTHTYGSQFVAADCAGSIPDDRYRGLLMRAMVCGGWDGFAVIQPGDDYQKTIVGPAFVLTALGPEGCPDTLNADVEVMFVRNSA